MGNMDYFPAFFKYRRSLKDLTDEQVGRVFRAALEYGEDGTVPRLGVVEKMAFAFIMADIDVAREKYTEKCAKLSKNAQERWDKSRDDSMQKDAIASKSMQEIQMNTNDTKQTDIQTDIHTDNFNDSVPADAATPAKKPAKKFTPPTVDEIAAYCAENGLTVDAERFVDYYSANGWKVGNQAMKDWKATARNWSRREKERGYTAKPAKPSTPAESSFETEDFFDAALMRTYGDDYKFFKEGMDG